MRKIVKLLALVQTIIGEMVSFKPPKWQSTLLPLIDGTFSGLGIDKFGRTFGVKPDGWAIQMLCNQEVGVSWASVQTTLGKRNYFKS